MHAYILSRLSARIVKWLKHFLFPKNISKTLRWKGHKKIKQKSKQNTSGNYIIPHVLHTVLVSFSILPQGNIVYTGHCCVHYVISNWGWCAQKAPGWLIWLDLIQLVLPNGDNYTWTSRLCRLAMSPMQDGKLSSNVQLFLTQVLSCTAWSLIKNRMCILDLQPNLQQQK